jgi:hypothetical protein
MRRVTIHEVRLSGHNVISMPVWAYEHRQLFYVRIDEAWMDLRPYHVPECVWPCGHKTCRACGGWFLTVKDCQSCSDRCYLIHRQARKRGSPPPTCAPRGTPLRPLWRTIHPAAVRRPVL